MKEKEYINKATEYCIANRDAVIDWDTLSDDDREHIYSIAASVMMARDNYCDGGGFVQGIVANDLRVAVCSADHICIRALKLFVFVKMWAFLSAKI